MPAIDRGRFSGHLPHSAPAGVGADLLDSPAQIPEQEVRIVPIGVADFRNRVDDEAPAWIYVVPEDAGDAGFRRIRLDSMEPAHQDYGIKDAVQPVPGERVCRKAGVAPEVRQTDDLGSFQDGRIIVETEAIIKVKVEQDVPETAADVRHSPTTISRKGIQVFDDTDGIILGGQRHAMPRVKRQKQPHEEPEGNLAPVSRSPDDALWCNLHDHDHARKVPRLQAAYRPIFFRNPSIPSRYCPAEMNRASLCPPRSLTKDFGSGAAS